MQSVPETPAPAPEQWPAPPFMPVYPVARPGLFLKVAGLLIGIMIFVGAFAFHVALILPRPAFPGQPQPDPDTVAYLVTLRILGVVSAAFMDLAVAVSVTLAWYVATAKPEIAEGARRGILIFATVFLAVWLIFSFGSFSFFGFLR